MISQMCQDSLAESDSNKTDNFQETVYLIKNYLCAFLPRTFFFIVVRIT